MYFSYILASVASGEKHKTLMADSASIAAFSEVCHNDCKVNSYITLTTQTNVDYIHFFLYEQKMFCNTANKKNILKKVTSDAGHLEIIKTLKPKITPPLFQII